MKRAIKISLLIATFATLISRVSAIDFDSLNHLSKSEFVKFHLSVVEVNSLRERQTPLPKVYIPEGSLSSAPAYQELIELIFINQAFAESREGKCMFGGWASFTVNGSCKAPWNYSSDQELQQIGPTYSSDFYCGKRNLFRCNPILFGPGDSDGKGHCITLENGSYENLSLNCFKKAQETPEKIFELYRNDPNYRMAYLNLVEETMIFCADATDYDACRPLIASVQSAKNFVCNDNTLDQLLGSERFMELENIWGSLESELIQNKGRAQALGERVTSHVEEHPFVRSPSTASYPEITGTDFDNYSNSPQVRSMIDALERNLDYICGQGPQTCKRERGVDSKGRSLKGRSLRKCWRYVKNGLMSGGLSKNYINSEFAVDAGRGLKQNGFINLLDSNKYSNMTPQSAPPGAIIVYRKVGAKSGRPGHIEVKTLDGRFMSDYVDTRSINQFIPKREVVGIYINPNVGEE